MPWCSCFYIWSVLVWFHSEQCVVWKWLSPERNVSSCTDYERAPNQYMLPLNESWLCAESLFLCVLVCVRVSAILTHFAYKILIHILPGNTDDQYDKMLLFLAQTWSHFLALLYLKQEEIEPHNSFSFELPYICIPWLTEAIMSYFYCPRGTFHESWSSRNQLWPHWPKMLEQNLPERIMSDLSVLYFKFQNFLRNQNNKNNYNLVCETLQFLDCICGSTTGGLGLLGLYINEKNVGLINQTVESLTEYCQGPCHENQVIRSLQFRMGHICTKLPNCKCFICISNCFLNWSFY